MPNERVSGRHFGALSQEILSHRATSGAIVTTSGTIIPMSPQRRIAVRKFTGNGWIRGKKITGMNSDSTKPFLQISLATNPATVTEQAGSIPNPWGDNDLWRAKADIAGDLYID
jgi:hypothetical protein